MTTTDHHEHLHVEGSSDSTRQQRLATLLIRRKRLPVRWAEEFSHQLPDADDMAYELAVTEEAIAHCYPSIYDAQFAQWVAHDAALIHGTDAPNGQCRLCAALTGTPDAA